MPGPIGSKERWQQSGENSAGDPMYSRVNVGTGLKDYSEMTKEELQSLLGHMGLPKTGNKDELVERLQEATHG